MIQARYLPIVHSAEQHGYTTRPLGPTLFEVSKGKNRATIAPIQTMHSKKTTPWGTPVYQISFRREARTADALAIATPRAILVVPVPHVDHLRSKNLYIPAGQRRQLRPNSLDWEAYRDRWDLAGKSSPPLFARHGPQL